MKGKMCLTVHMWQYKVSESQYTLENEKTATKEKSCIVSMCGNLRIS